MLASGERWRLGEVVPGLVDKHSTGGVGDKVSLLLAPLLSACGVPVVMLTGRGLGHTAGTADKLESIPGLDLALDRERTRALLDEVGMAIGIATARVAPADRRLYELRDQTANVASIPLIVASILSKKLAAGAGGLALDVKTGPGAFMSDPVAALQLAERLVSTCRRLGVPAAALLTDMSQPLGRWAGHGAEVREVWEALSGGELAADLKAVTFALSRTAAALVGVELDPARLDEALGSGRAREVFTRWAERQGAAREWLATPDFPLAPLERPLRASRSGVLAGVHCRQLGLLLVEAAGGRRSPGAALDHGVSLRVEARLGDPVAAGQELARLYLRQDDADLVRRFAACFEVADQGTVPPLFRGQVGAGE
jgi:thymidine phosphorylase